MTRYAAMFERLEARGEGAFIPFVTLGDPNPDESLRAILALVEGGADALELGLPFSDPIADGPTIQAAAVRALAAGTRAEDCWRIIRAVRDAHPALPIGLLVYANLVINPGIDAFYKQAADAGCDSILVADAPSLEVEPFARAALAHGIDPVMIAPLNASPERLEIIARVGRGYTYVVTRSGVTGAREALALDAHRGFLSRLRELSAAPAILGFGISLPEHVRAALDSGAAGAISGSAVVARIARTIGQDEATRLESLRGFVREMKAATVL